MQAVLRILIRKFLWSPGPGSLIFCTDPDPRINEQTGGYKNFWLPQFCDFWPGSESLSKRSSSGDTTSKWTQQFNNVRKAPYTDYCTIYKGPGFLAVVWFGASHTPSSVGKLSPFLSLPVCRRPILLKGEGGRGGTFIHNLYDGKKAWSSINKSYPVSYCQYVWMYISLL